ncbi:IS3 family transposase [Streptomyces sp. DT195]|uniref:IS3 family transposase n=1 Tax=Streptomyces sp. DT195 TaxID=3393419 RepID=UPI003CF004C7
MRDGESGGAYGSPRVTAELHANGLRVDEKRVTRITRTFSIARIRLRRRVRVTASGPAASQMPDLLQKLNPVDGRLRWGRSAET